jgi:ABC-type sugar transport system ATPase subunit
MTAGQTTKIETARPAVAARNISKRYGATRALNEVSLEIRPGSVHALLGENGAGKSTLVKILSGSVQPDEGAIEVAGKPVVMTSPTVARRSGIAVVHQELSLFPLLNVVSNVYAGSERHAALGWMKERAMRAELAETMASLGWSIPAELPVGRLSLAEQQMVEIVRAFHFHADLVLLDEPNSSFTDAESRALYDAVRRFRAKGQAFLLVSHRLDEVMAVADEVTILRDGRVVHHGAASALTVADAVRLMVGDKGTARTVDRPATTRGPVRIAANSVAAGRLHELSLSVRGGEIVGIAGLEGAGVQEFFEALFGTRKLDHGDLSLDGRAFRPRSSADAIRYGVASIPADRRTEGLLMNRAVKENIVLVVLGRLATAFGAISDRAIRDFAKGFVDRFRIRIRDAEVEVATLSGGNQQKVVLAKWLALEPVVLLLNDPTRGIDVGAKAEVHQVVREMAAKGVAVLVWSSETDELLNLCDRIVVLANGRQTAELDPAEIGRHELVMAVAGGMAA